MLIALHGAGQQKLPSKESPLFALEEQFPKPPASLNQGSRSPTMICIMKGGVEGLYLSLQRLRGPPLLPASRRGSRNPRPAPGGALPPNEERAVSWLEHGIFGG